MSAAQSLLSMLQWNNETINFWSHYSTFLFFLWKLSSLNFNLANPEYWPLVSFAIGVCSYPLLSSIAHAFCSMSAGIRHICFFCDYAGVSLYTMGSSAAFYAYGIPEHVRVSIPGLLYLPISVIFAVASCMVCCLSRDAKFQDKKFIMRTTAYAVPYAFGSCFVLHRLLTSSSSEAVWFYYSQFFWSVMIAVSNTCKFPERFFSGKFDIIGQSHQWFHLFIFVATNQHATALLLDIEDLKKSSTGVPVFPFMSSLGLMLLVLLLNLIIVLYFSWRILGQQSKDRSD